MINTPTTTTSAGRTLRAAAATSAVLALTLALAACGTEQGPSSSTPATPAVNPSQAADESASSSEEPTSGADEHQTSSPVVEASTTGDEAGDKAGDEAGDEAGDAAGDEETEVGTGTLAADIEPGTQRAAVKAYVDALAAGDTGPASGMLSSESRELLGDGLGGDDVLADEPWLSEFQADALTFDTDGKECHWLAHEAWQGAGDDLQVVEITCWSSGIEDSSEYGFGVRRVDGTWVVDQDRIDVSTGGTWVEFLNPTWEGAFDPSQPASFTVGTDAGAPEHVMLRANGSAVPVPLTESEGATSSTVVFTQSEGGMAMPGIHNLLVTGRTAGSDLIRAHGIVFGVSEGS